LQVLRVRMKSSKESSTSEHSGQLRVSGKTARTFIRFQQKAAWRTGTDRKFPPAFSQAGQRMTGSLRSISAAQWLAANTGVRLAGSVPLHQLDCNAPSDHHSRPLQAPERDVVFRIKDAVNLGTARLEQRCQLVLGYFLLLHGFGELPRDDLFDRLSLRLFEDALLLEVEPIRFLLIAPTRSDAFAPSPGFSADPICRSRCRARESRWEG
jgi:hypothetical protein